MIHDSGAIAGQMRRRGRVDGMHSRTRCGCFHPCHACQDRPKTDGICTRHDSVDLPDSLENSLASYKLAKGNSQNPEEFESCCLHEITSNNSRRAHACGIDRRGCEPYLQRLVVLDKYPAHTCGTCQSCGRACDHCSLQTGSYSRWGVAHQPVARLVAVGLEQRLEKETRDILD